MATSTEPRRDADPRAPPGGSHVRGGPRPAGRRLRAVVRGCSCGSRGLLLLVLAVGHVADHARAGRRGGPRRLRLRRRRDGRSPFWRTWDWVLLVLALIHGINGLRVITLDYVRPPGVRLAAQHVLLRARLHAVRAGHRHRVHVRPVEVAGGYVPDMTTTHTYDAVIVGAGGAGLRAAIEASGPRPHRRDLQALPDPLAHRGGAGRDVRRARRTWRRTTPEWHAFDTVKGGDYLVDQPAAQLMTEEAVDAVYQLEHWGLPFNRTPEGRIDQRRFGGHTRNHGEAPVKRACYAADRTGHMILQTLYQQCVKRDVRFFNEFYCLDLLDDDDGRAAGVVAYELATGELHVFRAKAVLFATGGYGRMFKVSVQRPRPHRRRPRGRVPARHPARGHGVLPVPSDRPVQARASCSRRPRAARARSCEQGRRAVHGALRPDDQGPRAARHGRAARSTRRSRRAAATGRTATWSTWTSRHLTRR